MKYTDKHKFKQPERTKENDDRADINDLTGNWAKVDTVLESIEDSQTEFARGLQAHTSNVANPHRVTATQTGAYTKDEMDSITDAQNLAIADAVETAQVTQQNLVSHMDDKANPHEVTTSQIGAYSVEETNNLLDKKLSREGELNSDRVVISGPGGRVDVSSVTPEELLSLTGVAGNIQNQLNHVPKYNYLEGIEAELAESEWPEQVKINDQVIPVIKAAYGIPELWDAVVVRVSLKNSAVHRDLLYYYQDGSLKDNFIGWRFLVEVSTVIARADGESAGIVKSSDDIAFVDGKGAIDDSFLKYENLVDLASSIIPGSSGVFDFGAPTKKFRNGHFTNNIYAESFISDTSATLSAVSGNVRLQNSSGVLVWIPSVNGPVFRPAEAIANAANLGSAEVPWCEGYFGKSLTLNGETITEWPTSATDTRMHAYTGQATFTVLAGACTGTEAMNFGSLSLARDSVVVLAAKVKGSDGKWYQFNNAESGGILGRTYTLGGYSSDDKAVNIQFSAPQSTVWAAGVHQIQVLFFAMT